MSLDCSDAFFFIPLRVGLIDRPDWTLCSTYLKKNFSESFSDSFTRVHVFNSMNELHRKTVEVFQPSCVCARFNDCFAEEVVIPYCKLVVQAQGHFPLHNGKVSPEMAFAWEDSFPVREDASIGGSSAKKGKKEVNATTSVCVLDSNIEIFSCVYNLGAAYSALGADLANTGNSSKIKLAYTYFQQSAGFFQLLEEAVSSVPEESVRKTNELQKTSISALRKLSLAQAHHCGYLSAKSMEKPEGLLSKLSVKAAELYEDIQLRKTPLCNSSVGQCMTAQVEASAHVFRTRSHFHLGLVAEKETEMGLAVAHYYECRKVLNLVSLSLLPSSFKAWLESLEEMYSGILSRAEKVNNTVCRQPIPTALLPPEGLPKALGAPIVYSSSFLKVEESTKENDPFWGIVVSTSGFSDALQTWRKGSEELLQRSSARAAAIKEKVSSSLRQLGVENYVSMANSSSDKQPESPIPDAVLEKLRHFHEGSNNRQLVAPLLAQIKYVDQKRVELLEKLEKSERFLKEDVTILDIQYIKKYGEVLWRREFPEIAKSEMFSTLIALLEEQKNSIKRNLETNLNKAKKEVYVQAPNISLIEMSPEELALLIPSMKYNQDFIAVCQGLENLMAQKHSIEQAQTEALGAAMRIVESDKLAKKLTSATKEHQEIIFSQETTELKNQLLIADKCTGNLEALLHKAEEKMVSVARIQSTDTAATEGQRILNDLLVGIAVYPQIKSSVATAAEYAAKSAQRVDEIVSSINAFRDAQTASAVASEERLDAKIAHKMESLSPSDPGGAGNFQPTYCPPGVTSYSLEPGSLPSSSFSSSLQSLRNNAQQINYPYYLSSSGCSSSSARMPSPSNSAQDPRQFLYGPQGPLQPQ